MDYEQAKSHKKKLEKATKEAGDNFRGFLDKHPRGPMNLTPDHVRAMPEFKAHKANYDRAFHNERSFNKVFLKHYGKQYKAEVTANRRAKIKNEEVSSPTNSMGTSSSTSGPIQTFDPLLQRNKMLSRIKNILRKKKNG